MRRLVSNGVDEPREVRSAKIEPSIKIPHDSVNEQILLAAAVLDPKTRTKLVARLKSDAFLVREHVEAWLAICELERRKLDYDHATIRQLSGGRVDTDFLEQLINDRTSVPANIDHHIAMLEWDRTRIDAVRGPVAALLDAIKDPVAPPERVRALAANLSSTFERGTTSSLIRDPDALVQSAIAELRGRRERACYPYGIPGLDMQDDRVRWRMVPGAAPGQITVLTGVPGSGKSTVAARIALAQANAGRRVMYGAWEMGDENSLELLATMSLGWSRYRLSTGDISDEDEALLTAEMRRLSQYIRFVAPPSTIRPISTNAARTERVTNERILDQIHAMITDVAADVFIADLWKRCLRQIDPEEEEQALIRQQSIAAATKCHCILLQQQRSKDIEARDDKRPTREGIKGSGAWVEVADTILGVHRAGLYKAVDDVTIEIDVLKQRRGVWPMAIEFEWDSEFGAIRNGTTVPYDQPAMTADEPGGGHFLAPSTKDGKRRGKR